MNNVMPLATPRMPEPRCGHRFCAPNHCRFAEPVRDFRDITGDPSEKTDRFAYKQDWE